MFTAPGNPYPCVCDTTGLFSERGQASENTGGLSPLHPIMSFAAYAGLVLFSTDPYVLACSKVSDHTAAEGDGQISEHGKILLHGNACGLTAAQAVRLARTFGF